MLYIILVALIAWLLYEVKIEDSASSSAQSMTLNLQDFQPSSSSESEEEIPQEAEVISQEVQTPSTQNQESPEEEMIQGVEALDPPKPIADTNTKEVSKEALEALTKELFEKIAKSAKTKEQTAEKKVTPSEALLENLLAQKSEEVLEQKRLAKTVTYEEKLAKEKRLEDKLRKEAFLKAQEKKQEMQAKEKTFEEEQERLAKKEEKAKKLAEKKAEKIAREEAYGAQQAQIRKMEKAKAAKEKRIEKSKKEAAKKRKELREKRLAAKKAMQKRKKAKAKHKGDRKQKHKSKNNLANALSKHSKKTPPRGHVSRSTRNMINRFYGAEFNGFTGTQKAFIEQNLANIYVITQRVLSRRGYPDVALRTRQQGTQLVTFYLHPNGRISRLRLKKRIGYTSLDKNTLQVVRIAHANYPRPKTTTKITFYVEYSLD